MFVVYDDSSHNSEASKVFRRTNAGDYCSLNWDETVGGGLTTTTTAIISILHALNDTRRRFINSPLHSFASAGNFHTQAGSSKRYHF